ncbi:hypothetical protein M0C34_14545 [Agarivorans sp. TSD2052]|uniref:hypothetical protein n=1 Tax=Agarivorans sp. TSD2052 TaxID=2937286 RepID=UPI00201064A6|nr:hypothetical protein [Agarivorans sp. TSD2052]UPW17448.1 hypothetical protein M0C34_14545 [Agarivorans sp. TSD2052]
MNKALVFSSLRIAALLPLLFSPQLIACELSSIPAKQQQHGCGCNYYFPAKAPLRPAIVLQTQLDGTQAMMMREGALIELWGAQPKPFLIEPGTTSMQAYRYQNTAIKVENTERPGCTFGQQGCEVIGYLSQISMADNYQQCQWLIQGDCGC